MPYLVEVTINVKTGEHLGTRVIREVDESESPMPELIRYLAEQWRKEHPDD